MTTLIDNQVQSRQRVTDHGEVFTAEREVNAMLDLVKQETERIESRFLEPACGTGNFLVEILRRKLSVASERHRRNQLEFERYAVLAVSSIYGIDLLPDNVERARERLLEIVLEVYASHFKKDCKDEFREAVHFILSKNIIVGDTLELKALDNQPITFSEWSLANSKMMKRRDFTFRELLDTAPPDDSLPLFSDLGEEAFIPRPVKDYPLIHFLRVAEQD